MRLDLFRQNVLALMTVDARFLVVANAILHPRYFEQPVEQHLARFILEHYREYNKPPSKVVLLNRAEKYFKGSKNSDVTMEDFTEFLSDTIAQRKDAAEEAEYIAGEVVAFCREQAVKEATLKTVDDIQKGDLSTIVPRMQKALAIGSELQGRGVFLFGDAQNQEINEKVRDCVPTGLPFIDKPTRGGLARGEYGMLMAPPNVGKTTGLVNIGVGTCKQRFKVAHISMEMSEPLMLAMYKRCFLDRSWEQLTNLDDDQQVRVAKWLFKHKANLKADVNIKHFSAHRLSVAGLRAHIMLLRSIGFDPDAVVLDYMDLMEMPTHIRDEVNQLTWVGEELRALAEEENLAMWSATQTNRSGAQKQTSKMEDVAGDFKKMATADVVWSLNQNEEEQQEDLMRWFVVKNRVGKKHNTYSTITNFEHSRIEPA